MICNSRFVATRITSSSPRLLATVHRWTGLRSLHSDKPSQDASATGTRDHEHKTTINATEGLQPKSKPLTMAERDAELMARLEERSGDGGSAGLELEDGQAPAMKRGVRENMFRLI